MDNEEIKKLLQELKESSDESSSVRSKVVKIHVDTPAEAQKREREKRKKEEREARKRQEEEERARAEEEARRLEAEKAAQEAVEEAKREAKAGFAADLDTDLIKTGSSFPEGEEPGENADDLDLNWSYEKPELKSGFAREENFDIGIPQDKPGQSESAIADATPEDEAHQAGQTGSDERDDFESDEDEFRSEDEAGITSGLPGLFGAISDRILSFAGGIRKTVKDDLSKVKANKDAKDGDEEAKEEDPDGEEETAPEEDSDKAKAAADDSKEMRELPSYWDDEPSGGMNEADFQEGEFSEDAGHGKTAAAASGEDADSRKEALNTADTSEDAPDDFEDSKDFAKGDKKDSGDTKKSTPEREYGPDEEWKRRLEEPPKKKSFFEKLRSDRVKRSRETSEIKEKKPRRNKKKKPEKTAESLTAENTSAKAQENAAEDAAGAAKEAVKTAQANAAQSEELLAKGIRARDMLEEEGQEEAAQIGDVLKSGLQDMDNRVEDALLEDASAGDLQKEAASREAVSKDAALKEAASKDAALKDAAPKEAHLEEETAGGAGEDLASSRNIEVINLNENENNKDASVIPLTEDTGALPDPEELNQAKAALKGSKGKGLRRGFWKAKAPKENKASAVDDVLREPSRFSVFLAEHKKMLLIGAAVLAAVIIVAVAAVMIIKNMPTARKASIEADEGLTISILEQPQEFTAAGDVKLRATAPETIQSVTVNGENVVVDQGRSVDFTFHATGGTLEVMAVSTDKVRSARIILAYVDSAPPAVTIKEENGSIVMNAEDAESGVEGIYVGTFDGLSEIPHYKKYSEPLTADPDTQVMYYAKDIAGNTSLPTKVALTPAKTIEFEQERYTLFPGSTVRVNLITTPENAFVNNLSLEAENSKVVQIEGDFQLKGMAEGDTKISATADGISGVMASVSVSNERTVTISAVGDCTLGTDTSFSQNNSLPAYEALYGTGYFFEKVKGILSSDDTTFANFEGTLTTSEERDQSKLYAFKGDPSYTQILLDGSIDTVTLANNHRDDYGETGRNDTEKALEDAGIEWCYGDHIAYRELNGVLTAYIGIRAVENQLETLPQVKSTIAEAKKKGAELIIIEFHWGAELVSEIDEYQRELAHAAVDAGANLVLGSHAHLLLGIEKYNGVYIVYGLSNFCFGGNVNPSSYDSMIWRQTFTFTSDGLASEDDIAIIPCQISGDLTSNNYQPVPVSGDAAKNIMDTIDSLSAEFGQSYSQYMVDGTLWTEDSGA